MSEPDPTVDIAAIVTETLELLTVRPRDDSGQAWVGDAPDWFGESARDPEAQRRTQAAMKRGFQTRDAELDLARMLDDLVDR